MNTYRCAIFRPGLKKGILKSVPDTAESCRCRSDLNRRSCRNSSAGFVFLSLFCMRRLVERLRFLFSVIVTKRKNKQVPLQTYQPPGERVRREMRQISQRLKSKLSLFILSTCVLVLQQSWETLILCSCFFFSTICIPRTACSSAATIREKKQKKNTALQSSATLSKNELVRPACPSQAP